MSQLSAARCCRHDVYDVEVPPVRRTRGALRWVSDVFPR